MHLWYVYVRSSFSKQQGDVRCDLPGGRKAILRSQSFALHSLQQVSWCTASTWKKKPCIITVHTVTVCLVCFCSFDYNTLLITYIWGPRTVYLFKEYYYCFKFSFLYPRFKLLLANRPAAENTCIEISHVKYNVFQVQSDCFTNALRRCECVLLFLCCFYWEGKKSSSFLYCGLLSVWLMHETLYFAFHIAGDAVSVLWWNGFTSHQKHWGYGCKFLCYANLA